MRYGYFDDDNKEYVIERPDTPQSWSNYLGSTEYGAVITNNAGGYGFYKSGARGRFLRLRFNSIPMDQPGRYIYLRDNDTGDFWSGSWQPVGKPLDRYASECRHGTAYTRITSDYTGIHTDTTYFVPLEQAFEYWKCRITNSGSSPRSLSAFSYCEFTNQWETFQDQVNLQYSLFINQGSMENGILKLAIQDNLTRVTPGRLETGGAYHTWMTLIGPEISGYDTSREAFLGTYGAYHCPQAVKHGRCSNSNAYGDNSCGSIQTDLTLEPGESRDLLFMVGIGEAGTTGARTVADFGSVESADRELQALKTYWHGKLENFHIQTPDHELNSTINMWGLYNCLITFAWSRAASLVYNGERDGLGFRDSVQDILGVCAAIPEEAGKRLELLLTGQLSNGGAIPVIKPFEHRPGKESQPPSEQYRSDDCLWFFNAVPAYVAETGDLAFYSKVLPYADKGEATVFGHLRKALDFNLERTGAHGLPCGLSADWNDCLRLGYYGESLFVAFQLRLGLSEYARIARVLGNSGESAWALSHRDSLDQRIQEWCWDGEWFIWAIAEDGTVFGTKDCDEGQVYLNTQVWSVISGAASDEQAEKAMNAVSEKLSTPFGLMLSAPPFRHTSIDIMRAVVFNPGVKENAGIFNHTQGWGIMAECMRGNGNTAYEYLRAGLPAAYNEKAEIRQMEPYVQGQTTYSTFSPRPGTTRTSWLTGAAAWSYYSICQYILGIRPEEQGLRIDPCIPDTWDGFSGVRMFRGKRIVFEVRNPRRVQKGVSSVTLNGTPLKTDLIPAADLKDENHVTVVMGNKKYS
ncbi:MAG: N,N'-diacetylchitobiose phosphorylase [Spirochaetales bacterium]|nr:N,N'-diacetylchitobiose phosphorylase [Spirochaetales bacterium]